MVRVGSAGKASQVCLCATAGSLLTEVSSAYKFGPEVVGGLREKHQFTADARCRS